jgi:hypothetical protein
MTPEEKYLEWVDFHTRIKQIGSGEEWFEKVDECPFQILKDIEAVLADIKEHLDSGDTEYINKFRYNFRPPYCSSIKL